MTTQQALHPTQVVRFVGQAMVDHRWGDVLAHLAPDVVLHVPTVGTHNGIDAVADFLVTTTMNTEDGEAFELLDVLVGEQYSALYFHVTAQRSGRPELDNYTVHLARLDKDNRIAEIWFHNFDSIAVADFWA